MIAAQYGDMLACLALAKMRHGDLHGNNILVTHNLKAFKYSWGPQMRMRIYFRFHVIDWGFGTPISSESYQTNGIPKAICTWKDLNFAYNPKYQKPSDDWNQEDWRVMFAVLEETGAGGTTCKGESWHGMYLLLKALYHTKDPVRDMAVDGIPRAHRRLGASRTCSGESPAGPFARNGPRHRAGAHAVQGGPETPYPEVAALGRVLLFLFSNLLDVHKTELERLHAALDRDARAALGLQAPRVL